MDQTESFQTWNGLFDALCNRAGYFDDAELAGAYCRLTKSRGQKQFEAAVRNLNNWRSSRHMPRPANLKILAKLLAVENDPALQAQWEELYRQSRNSIIVPPPPPAVYAPPAAPMDVHFVTIRPGLGQRALGGPKRWSNRQAVAGGLALALIGAALGSAVTASDWRPWGGPADDKPVIPFNPVVNMRVGDSRPIYAVRGDCGKLPPDWTQLVPDMPVARTGEFSDGGLARRYSKFCQGLTPARAIVFSATSAGVDEFVIQGDFFKMTVID